MKKLVSMTKTKRHFVFNKHFVFKIKRKTENQIFIFYFCAVNASISSEECRPISTASFSPVTTVIRLTFFLVHLFFLQNFVAPTPAPSNMKVGFKLFFTYTKVFNYAIFAAVYHLLQPNISLCVRSKHKVWPM